MQLPGLAPDEERRFHDGMHHMAYEYGSFDALNATYLRFRRAGIEPQVCMDHEMTLSYYYADPDGNLLELQVDLFGDWDQSSDWMRNRLAEAEFLVGASVDPARIAEAYADDMTLEDIHEKAYVGGFSPGTRQISPSRRPARACRPSSASDGRTWTQTGFRARSAWTARRCDDRRESK